MNGGGVRGLMGGGEEERMDLDPEEKKMIEDQFNKIYSTEPKLRDLLGTDPSKLSLKEKYQIIIAYEKGGI
jgi:hypothetical protein